MPIPNNIGLSDDSPLGRQLNAYQDDFRRWWERRGPAEFLDRPMNLRIPTGLVEGSGWTRYHTMTPRQYCWGLYMLPPDQERIEFGEHVDQPVWTELPADYRSLLFEHIRSQGDAENASIEQSRSLTLTAPSQMELQNVFQFYVEESRHAWSMIHLLLAYFGADGVAEAEEILQRTSGDVEKPRLLHGFNYHTEDWLSHFMWCFLADRVGRYQLQAVTRGAFAPLARAARFMMYEEPLHISFGTAGLQRILRRSAQLTLQQDSYDIFDAGAIPLPVFQKYFNYWISKVFDLFGNDESGRAYELYRIGIRAPRKLASYGEGVQIDRRVGEGIEQVVVEPERAINAILRRQYLAEVVRGVQRWNRILEQAGTDFRLYVPHERFNRSFGPCATLLFDVDGHAQPPGSEFRINDYFPQPEEIARVRDLMRRELNPGQFASWISPPQPGELEWTLQPGDRH